MQCEASLVLSNRPVHPQKTRSRICAISILKGCAHDGTASSSGRHFLICRGICCLRSWPSGFRPIVLAISTMRPERFWIALTLTSQARRWRDRLESLDRKRTDLTPGTVLVREWDRQSHRVMVLAEGFAWNGQTYDSLTKVAFAITGTRWNGPRFFGLRDKQAKPALRPGDEDDLGQTRSLRHLYPGLHRPRSRSGVQFAGCPVRGLVGLHQEPGPCRLDSDQGPL